MKSIITNFSKSLFLGISSTSTIAVSCFANDLATKNTPQISFEYNTELSEKFKKDYGIEEKSEIESIITKEIVQVSYKKIDKITIIINDVKPNRPTREQLNDNPSLSMKSFGIGGINLFAKTFDEKGNFIKDVSYNYYGTDINSAQYDWIWSDVKRGAYRFAKKIYEN